jgi:hypothetical protein
VGRTDFKGLDTLLGYKQTIIDGKACNFSRAVQVQFGHQVTTVRNDRWRGQVQLLAYFC